MTSQPDSPELKALQHLLFKAIEAVDVKAVESLISKDGDVARCKNDDGVPAIVAAVQTGDAGLARLVLEAAPDMVDEGNSNGSSALMFAALSGDIPMMKLLDQANADLEHCNASGVTALMTAARKGQREAVKWLSDAGVNLARTDKSGMNAAGHARAGATEDEVLAKAIENKESEQRPSREKLFKACDEGDVSAVALIILQHTSASFWRDKDGLTGLMRAAQAGQELVAKMLIAGAPKKIDAVTANGSTAFLYAAFGGYLDIMKRLEAAGADTCHRNHDGRNAVMLAAAAKQMDVLAWFTNELPPEKIPDTKIMDTSNRSAMEYARGDFAISL